MKIPNPTVFLRDGELFCLTVEVPEYPDEMESKDAPYFAEVREELLIQAKSSAVKVKNKESVFGHWYEEQSEALFKHLHNESLFTLNGYEAELSGITMEFGYELATITPISNHQESQEDIWAELEDKVRDSQWFAGDLYYYMKSRFTIQRKSK